MGVQYESDICTLALYEIGQQVPITNPLGGDTSAAGKVCQLLYPQVRDALLKRFPWPFAKKQLALLETTEDVGSGLDLSDFQYAYTLPADCLQPRYIWTGARPGAPISTWVLDPDFIPPDTVSVMPAIDGAAVAVPFETVGAVLYTDWYSVFPDWDSSLAYAQGAPVQYNGHSFTAAQATSAGQAPSSDGTSNTYWTATTVSKKVDLVYTAQVTDVTKFPAEFLDVLVAKLAARLAKSQAAKPDLARELELQAEQLLVRAASVANTGREPDRTPDSSFTTVRG